MVERCEACQAKWADERLIVCLDCGDGGEYATAEHLRLALDVAREWLARAGIALSGMDGSDPRHAQAAAQVTRRQGVYRGLEEMAKVNEATRLEARYPFAVRWARQKGVLLVRDVFDGDWLEIGATQAPNWWRWAATEDAKAERARGRRAA